MKLVIIVFALVSIASVAATAWFTRYALRKEFLDLPDERRLHQTPTPRGGGVAIAISALLAIIGGYMLEMISPWLIVIAGLIAASFGLLGFFDDHFNLGVISRLLIQIVLSALFLGALTLAAYVPNFVALGWLGGLTLLLALVACVWFVNLFNFMDGSDGYAASEAVLVALTVCGFGILFEQTELALLASIVGAAAGGFLYWNWAPARIFMGDVGSYFLGFELCVLTALCARDGLGIFCCLVLVTPFVVDASLTLTLRMVRREAWWQSHRQHIYQRLIAAGASHARVALGLILTTCFILVPIAYCCVIAPSLAWPASLFVYFIAVIIWLMLHNKLERHASSSCN